MRIGIVRLEHSSLQQRQLGGGHHEVVRIISVVHQILQLYALLLLESFEPIAMVDA